MSARSRQRRRYRRAWLGPRELVDVGIDDRPEERPAMPPAPPPGVEPSRQELPCGCAITRSAEGVEVDACEALRRIANDLGARSALGLPITPAMFEAAIAEHNREASRPRVLGRRDCW